MENVTLSSNIYDGYNNDTLVLIEPVAEVDQWVPEGNLSRREALEIVVEDMLDGWRYQSRISSPWRQIMILLYAFMICVGSIGNLMVIYVVARNPTMRTARNVFVVNLAISDLMLCLITMPLTLIEILFLTWQFGNIEVACRLIGLLQATSVFVSTISITAIALDRRRLIVGSEQESPEDMGKVVASIPLIWTTAAIMASPLAIWKTLENWTGWTAGLFVNDTEVCHFDNRSETGPPINEEDISPTCLLKEIIMTRLSDLQTCKENLPESGRTAYSCFVLLFQFMLPMITLCIAYYQICRTLRLRLEQRVRQRQANSMKHDGSRRNSVLKRNDERRERNIIRLKRTIKLLCWIGAIFCICWLPLNILNAVTDTIDVFSDLSDETFCLIYAVCHVLGMSSACANPVIYGFLNENFAKEFAAIGHWWSDGFRWVGKVVGLLPKGSLTSSTGDGFNNNDELVNNGAIGTPATVAVSVMVEDKSVEHLPLTSEPEKRETIIKMGAFV
ncbi:neuropeptide F receptor-like [Tigriopus californicus]|uniref:neuropeptide F receptor-like n=1 Tax=Tigriopus californicus TaxID=6832 RepID=UPI0027DA86AB|nr:neuropeptide F receptor-like [Tigriopus californicus]